MSIEIKFLDDSDKRMVQMLRAKGGQVVSALTDKLTRILLELQQKIVREKLSGEVLQHRTGVLAGSIVAEAVEVQGSEITGGVEGAGGPAFYGRFFESGTDRPYTIVPVNKKALAFVLNSGKTVLSKLVQHPPIKQRQFMGNTLAEMAEQIAAELSETIQGSINSQ